HLQQRRLARAVGADDAEHLALVDLEADVAQRPDLLLLLGARAPGHACGHPRRGVPQRAVRGLHLADAVALRELGCLDRGHQIESARGGSGERKTVSPIRKRAIPTPTPTAVWDQTGPGAPSTAHRQPAITAVIGLNARIHCHFLGTSFTAYITPERSGSTCR